MKIMNALLILLIVFSVAAIGCDGNPVSKKEDPDSNITVAAVDDPQLAELILKPAQGSVNVSRDPFKPLNDWSAKQSETKMIEPVKQKFNNLNFTGMIKMDDQAIALLKDGEKRIMLKINEKYKGFVLTTVANDQVMFSDGATQITLKRGTKK